MAEIQLFDFFRPYKGREYYLVGAQDRLLYAEQSVSVYYWTHSIQNLL